MKSRDWIPFLLAVMLLLGLLSTLNVSISIGKPFGGYFANRNHSSSAWQIDAPTPPWWPGIAEVGLRYDDILVTIDGQPFGSDYGLAYARAAAEGRESVRLQILRSGNLIEIPSPLYPFTANQFFELKFADLVQGLGFWLMAVAVYRARPYEPVNRIFAVASVLSGASLWLAISALFMEHGWQAQLLELAWCLSASTVGARFIHLAAIFPDFSQRRPNRWITALHFFLGGFAILYTISLLLVWNRVAMPWAVPLNALSNTVTMGAFGLSVLVYMARLLWLFTQRNLPRRVRRQVEILLIGLALAWPFVIIIVLRSVVHSTQSYFWTELDLRYLGLAVPLSFALVILRYQTFQRNPPALISTFILTSSAIVASLGAWFVRVGEPQWTNQANIPPFVPLFFVALLASIFWSLQSIWSGPFSRFFQWESRSYSAVRRFGQEIIHETDLERLPDIISRSLVKHLELEQAALWLWDEKKQTCTLAGFAGKWVAPPPPELTPPSPSAENQSIRLEATIPTWLRSLAGLEVAIQLTISGRPIALLGIGKRWDEEVLDERDLQIVELIAQQAALFIESARAVEQIRQMPQQINTAQERERFKIAQELHDTIQQFLGRLPFFLDVARSAAATDPAETQSLLTRCISDVENAAQVVRQIRNNLAPLQLENSFTQPLLTLIEHFRARYPIQLDTEITPGLDASLGPDGRHALYRVVQQALDNAIEHASATAMSISLTGLENAIHFTIQDNGRGFSSQQRAEAELEGSFGLKSMQARITSLGGEFSIQSAPGAGTKISGWLPLHM